MIKTIGKTIILNETEGMYKGKCTTDIVNKSNNIISIHRKTGQIAFLKIRNWEEITKKLKEQLKVCK